MLTIPIDQLPLQATKWRRLRDRKTIDITRELLLDKIHQKLSNLEKQKFGLRNGLIIPQSMDWDIIFQMRQQVCSLTTQQKLFLIQMVIISITWKEGRVTDKMLAMSTLYKSIQRSCRKKLLFCSISGVILKVMTVLKLL